MLFFLDNAAAVWYIISKEKPAVLTGHADQNWSDLQQDKQKNMNQERMKPMKKLLALLLLTVLLCSCVGAAFAADDDAVYFSPTLLNIFSEYTVTEWMSTSFNRALFAACGLLDYSIQDGATYGISNLYSGTVYVGRSENVLILAYNDPYESKSLFILYAPGSSSTPACYMILNIGKSGLLTGIQTLATDGYNLVSASDLKEVIDILQEALSK